MIQEKSDISYVQSGIMNSFENITHAFTGRTGGVSHPPLSSMNVSYNVGDESEHVTENRETLAQIFEYRHMRLITVNQTHSSAVVDAKKEDIDYAKKDADAIITPLSWHPIGVMTADCVPILLFDPEKKIIGAVHAGWKGTVQNIAEKTILAMQEDYGCSPGNIVAAIGPSIHKCCYTVGKSTMEEFKEALANIDKHLNKKTGAVDLAGINKVELEQAGLKKKNITMSEECTSCLHESFFSYRKHNARTGRQLSFIMLKEPEA